MFSIDQLEAFVTTVEQGSFSAAARHLNKVQSAISQHIMNLEIDCGVELFDRAGRYPILTADGQRLLPYAKASLIQHRRLFHCAKQLEQTSHQDITLAIDEGIPLTQLSQALKDVIKRYPTLRFECLAASSIDIRQLVIDQRATMGIMFSEASLDDNVDFEGLGGVEFDVYVSKDHPLATETIPHLDMLRLHRQVVIRSKTSEMSSFQQAFSPDVWFADSYFMLMELVASGFGWGMLPKHLAQSDIASDKLIRLRSQFENLAWQANIDVIQHQSVNSCPAHNYFRQRLRELRDASE
ncbi:LysR family transcriptional regulator [Vibrio panuliri]|uniref:LysR family transcriptional regulator n=1 Tax=Vibrio panuliri TaxID=1381081 RepID=A0ABX3F5A1_9VIBR|nr:LysR family transcriptional regulator [Vibrio panuliri]KAB1455527.1 LysR family transcriptional regulator [Vibrio panuliri]OLQ85140.1 LysR family transcriptional regulator [Vibrio panuliri]